MKLLPSLGLALGLSFWAPLASARELSPTLEVLPLNSTLSKVTIPRYDENKKCVAYLKADLMEILADGEPVGEQQPIMVDCQGIHLHMSSEAEVFNPVRVDMEQARFRITPGVLTVQEKITANSPKFTLNGSGGVFHLDTQRGFVFGPLDCTIFTEPPTEAQVMTRPAAALLASTSLILAEPTTTSTYRPPTAEELLRVEKAALPEQGKIAAEQRKTSESLTQREAVSQAASARLDEFSKAVDSDSLTKLIQNPPAPKASPQVRPPLENPDLNINCDGGCFFDGDENLLVLLRNVIVKDSRFTLKAKEEIKVFFLAEPAAKKKEKQTNKPKDPKTPDLKMSISGVKSLVASGGINFTGVDEKGNPVEASAETAFYDDESKVLILKGGTPSFWVKQDQLEIQKRAENPNASLRIEFTERGTIDVNTSGDGWEILVKNPALRNE